MLGLILDAVVRQRFLVIFFGIVLIALGVHSTLRLNVDAFPDVTNVQVQVNTVAAGLAATEVEQLVTAPIESVMTGIPRISEVRSISKTGLSVVTVVFDDDVDIYFARQLINERMQTAKERIPAGADPEMGPITTGMGQIYEYALTSETKNSAELRTLNDWLVKVQLRTVPGVSDVLSFGGEVRQYQVQIDPNRLLKYELTLQNVREAVQANNSNAGGWYIEGQHEQLVVRGEGMIRGGDDGLADIRNIVLKSIDGTPIYVRDVARVEYGAEIRQGAVTMNGKGEVVTGIVLLLKGANTKKVIEGVKKKVEAVQATLPTDVKLTPIYDQAMLVNKAVSTVSEALLESAALIVVVLFLFLWNVRSALVVVCSIPLSMLIAAIMMRWYGISANLQSLGGLAIGIGMMVDGSVVVVENIVRHLAEPGRHDQPLMNRISMAVKEVARPVFFAVLIIVVVFLPLFTLEGVEGKLFSPLAFTIAFAMFGSLIVALTIVPALAELTFRGKFSEKDSFLMRFLKWVYRPLLRWALAHRLIVVLAALAALGGSLATIPSLGTEFVPELDEGTMTIRVMSAPSIALEEAKRIAGNLEKRLLKYPEVIAVYSHIGRAELGGDPENINNNELFVALKPQVEWTTTHSRKQLIEIMEKDLAEQPGILLNFSQPIATRVDELLSGVKAQIAIKLFGESLTVLEDKGREIESVIKNVRGANDVQMEQVSGEAQLVVRADRERLARYGFNVAQVMEVVSAAVGGQEAGQVIDGQKRFSIYLRMDKPFRKDAAAIGNLWISSPDGARVLLSQVADIRVVEGTPLISRDSAQRRIVVLCNVRGRDMGGFVEEAQKTLRAKVKLPAGYFVTWGGQFENQQRAQATLMVVVPASLGLIFLLLCMAFASVKNALLIILNIPFALIGGILALYFTGQYLSVPSSVGFIALFGVAVLNGVVMVSYFNQLLSEGKSIDDAVVAGAMMRLRPVLMTATVASLGLIPLLLSTGIGSEVQRPLASVVVGGLLTSTLLTLLVLPALYKWFAVAPKASEPNKPEAPVLIAARSPTAE
ncbi:MAG TPA: CusA/CzcA family heavy metal efflux RND transporter [Planctomycetota bacterium]|jgi:cobalt-zinc-cadmium resistance protein CzcA